MAENNPLSHLLGQGLQDLAQNKLQQVAGRQRPMQQNQSDQFTQALNQLLNPQQQQPQQSNFQQKQPNLQQQQVQQPIKQDSFVIPPGTKPAEAKKLADVALKQQAAQSKEQESINKRTAKIL